MADETDITQQTQEPAVTPEPHVDKVRAAVEAAYDKSEAADGNASGQNADLAVRPGEPVKPVAAPAGGAPVRDPKTGKFVPAAKAAEDGSLPAKPATPTAAPAKPAAAPAPAAAGTPVKPGEEEEPGAKLVDRAPQSWRPAAKAEWAKLPAPVKAEALRLEREREAVLRDSSEARAHVEEFDSTVAPFRSFIQAAGHTPMQSVAQLMQTAATLQAGSEWDRAALVASIIRAHNVNPELVGAALTDPGAVQGYVQPQQPQGPMAFRDPRVDELFAGIRQQREALSSQADAQADSELDDFIASHPLAGDPDVQRRMARAMDLAGEDGVDMSFDEAYTGVLAVDAELRSIAEQQALASAPTPDGATARAEAAALSVRPSPVAAAPAPTLKGKGVEAHARAAYEKWEASARR